MLARCRLREAIRTYHLIPAARSRPSRCIDIVPRTSRGRREDRVFCAPAASHAVKESIRVSPLQVRRNNPAFPARWFTTYLRDLPGVRDLLVTVATPIIFGTLSTSPGVPGPHAFAVRIHAARRATRTTSIASRPTFVTTRTPLVSRRDSVTIIINFRKTEAKYFFQRGWTRIRGGHLSGKSVGVCARRLPGSDLL